MLFKKIFFFIGDFPEPEPKKCNYFGSGSGQKGRLRLRLRLRNTALHPKNKSVLKIRILTMSRYFSNRMQCIVN